MSGAAGPTFVERRPFRRGVASMAHAVLGVVIALVAAMAGAGWGLPMRSFLGAAAVLLVAPVFLTVVTEVAGSTLTVSVAPFWRRVTHLDEVARTDVVVADHLTPWFGGWNIRGGVTGALAATVEGDRSVGNRAVRLTLRSGATRQVGSWRPIALVQAIEAGAPPVV